MERARRETVGVVDERDADRLIAEYIEPDPYRVGKSEARLKGRGVAVWALVGQYRAKTSADPARQVAEEYEITPEQMRAALAYYERHRDAIDRRLAEADEE